MENPEGVQKGVKKVLVNGVEQAGKLLPCAPAGKTVEVQVWMG